ncbi:MAG: aminotransferase class V-fold PLP-dependent enzyme [Nocardioidaceae bacterium]|nr:aminotransferase class V-fold PLP-dependent enzyme [Nocardioidaceae bacterium]
MEYLADLSGVAGGTRASRLDVAYDRLNAHEHVLAERFMEGVERLDHVRLLGVTDRNQLAERTATFLLDVRNHRPGDVASVLGERGFFVWHGDFYAPGAVRSVGLGPDGGVRIGLAHYNSTDEVDGVLAELEALR